MKNYHLKMLISSCVLGLLLTIAHPANAQHSVNITNKTIAQAIKVIEGNTGYKFFYAENLPDFNKKVNFKIDNKSIETILTSLLKDTEIAYVIKSPKQIILSKKTS